MKEARPSSGSDALLEKAWIRRARSLEGLPGGRRGFGVLRCNMFGLRVRGFFGLGRNRVVEGDFGA